MTIDISGKVINGEHYGREIGFPTANLDRREYLRKKIKLRFGVWVGTAKVSLKIYKSGIVIGPIDKRGLPKIEAHLIGFKGSLYGKKMTLSLKKYLRPFKKFKSTADLKHQINKDILWIKKTR